MNPQCTNGVACPCNNCTVQIPIPQTDTTPQETSDELCPTCHRNREEECACVTCDNCERVYTEDNAEFCTNCRYCMTCCDNRNRCQHCEQCDRRRNSVRFECTNCNACDSCCDCHHCSDCESYTNDDDWCYECSTCNECCTCDSQIELLEGKDIFHPANIKEHVVIKSKRYLAVEIEIAKANTVYYDKIRSACANWGAAIVHDGSLPDNTGFEIPTAPASGDKFVKQINEICTVLNNADAEVDSSCGLHIHIDCRNFGWWEVQRLIKLYALIEDALFLIVPPSRRHNHYCARCADSYVHGLHIYNDKKKMKHNVLNTVYGTIHIKGVREDKYKEARYRALNIHSYLMRGTIECRLFNGTTNANKIIQWAKLWANIMDWVYTHKDKEVSDLKGQASFDVLKLLSPDEENKKWLEARWTEYSSMK